MHDLVIREATLPAGHRTIERTRQQLDAALARARDAAADSPVR